MVRLLVGSTLSVALLAGCSGLHAGPTVAQTTGTRSAQRAVGMPPAGANPNAGMIVYGGKLYGTATNGGMFGYGVVFKLTLPSTEVAIHDFQNNGIEGINPNGGLAAFPSFPLAVGTTVGGGSAGLGTVYLQKLTNGGGGGVIHSFIGSDGSAPLDRPLRRAAWAWGTTQTGGANGFGTVFKIKPNQSTSFQKLCDFQGGTSDGAYPAAGLTRGMIGSNWLYGTTEFGGANGFGTIFRINAAASSPTCVKIYDFQGGTDGAAPVADLTRIGSDLYGTTYQGGSNGVGTVFKYTLPLGPEIVLCTFQSTGGDGQNPAAAVVSGGTGQLYGTTKNGGAYSAGTIFSCPSGGGPDTVLHSFADPSVANDGLVPNAPLVQLGTSFYGTTSAGGANSLGTIYQYSSGVEAPIYSF